MSNEQHVRLVDKPACLICGAGGEKIHRDVSDRINGVPGKWEVRRGSCGECRALWLDPAPAPADVGKLYEGNYFTHSAGEPQAKINNSSWSSLERALLHSTLAYPPQGSPPPLISVLKAHISTYAQRTQARAMWLPYKQNGTLLDYGCGNGLLLQRMAELGWRVSGYDFDPIAAATASVQLGIQIFSGDDRGFLRQAQWDAITMSHVIEHLPDPRPVLTSLYENLAPGGRLSIATPNSGGLGERLFGRDWYNLSIPFHLYLYDPVSLAKLFRGLGFKSFKIWTSPFVAQKVWLTSSALRAGRKPHEAASVSQRLLAKTFAVTQRLLSFAAPSNRQCEELCAIVQRV